MARTALVHLAAAALVGALSADEPTLTAPARVLVELNRGRASDLQRTLQQTESLLAEQHQVTLFLDAEAVAHAVPGARPSTLETEIRAAFERLSRGGVVVLVCPHCARELGIRESGLRAPARFTTREELEAARRDADKIYEYREPDQETGDRTTHAHWPQRSGEPA